MKFNFKLKFCPKNSAACDTKHIAGLLGRLWQRIRTTLFLVFLAALVALGGYIWRQSLQQGGWSEERKQEYRDSRDKGVVFREDDFEKALGDIRSRQEKNAQAAAPLKDIFQPYE